MRFMKWARRRRKSENGNAAVESEKGLKTTESNEWDCPKVMDKEVHNSHFWGAFYAKSLYCSGYHWMKINKKTPKELFTENVGHRYSRCSLDYVHPGHAWVYPGSEMEDKPWWCDGEDMDEANYYREIRAARPWRASPSNFEVPKMSKEQMEEVKIWLKSAKSDMPIISDLSRDPIPGDYKRLSPSDRERLIAENVKEYPLPDSEWKDVRPEDYDPNGPPIGGHPIETESEQEGGYHPPHMTREEYLKLKNSQFIREDILDDHVEVVETVNIHNHEFEEKFSVNCEACNMEDARPDPDLKTASTEVTRWADEAMFKAAPIDASEGPKVYLLWMTPDPLGAIAAVCKMYKGEVVRDLSTVTDEERLHYIAEMQKTKLKAPLEFVKFHFLIEGVTRSFTHQMVRQRTAVYAQESLRFAVKEDMPVGLPPSLAGTDDVAIHYGGPHTNKERMRNVWDAETQNIREAYLQLIDMGMPAEDARGLLPHNVLTRLHYSTDLRALLDHAGNRLCTQAQFEWRLVFAKIIEAIRNADPDGPIKPKLPQGNVRLADKLLDAFKPVCYQTGKCEFKANFDRACSIRERVDAFERNGIPSSQWEQGMNCDPHDDMLPVIEPIKPGEWLLDPGAARKKA